MKVIIIGAGISGLTLAAALAQLASQHEVELYERDPSPGARRKGYAISLKGDGGLAVLERLGLRESVLTGGGQQVVRYGFQALGYETLEGRCRVIFTGGRHLDGDMVVGCDGVGSALRRQLVGDQLRFLGLSAITGDAALTSEDPLLSGGYFMTLGDHGDSFFCYTQPGTVHFSYTSHVEPSKLEPASQSELLDQVRGATADWHPLVRSITAAADTDSITPRGYYDRDPTKHIRDGDVWLIGDAAHPMSPFQGQGANTAMLDAVALAELLGSANLPADADRVAAGIVARGRKAVLESRRAAKQFHTTNRVQIMSRTLGFRLANAVINSRITRRTASRTETSPAP